MTKIKQTNIGIKGGLLKGNAHSEGGIKGIVADNDIKTATPIEAEGNEPVLVKEIAQTTGKFTYDGKTFDNLKEVASEINQANDNGRKLAEGGVILSDDAGAVIFEPGQYVINKTSASDPTLHEFNGKKLTNIQILSEINQMSGGAKIPDVLEEGGKINGTFKHKTYRVFIAYENYNDIKYEGNSKEEAKAIFDALNWQDNDYTNISADVMFEEIIRTYDFVHKIDPEYEELSDFPIEDYYDDETVYKEDEEEFQILEVDYKTIPGKEFNSSNLLEEVQDYLLEKYGRKYGFYNDIFVGTDENGEDVSMTIRLKDHSENPANRRLEPEDLYLSIVIANNNPTAQRFHSAHEIYFEGTDDIEKIKEEIDNAIKHEAESRNIELRKFQKGGKTSNNTKTLYHISKHKFNAFSPTEINEIGFHFFTEKKDCFLKENRGYIYTCKVKLGNILEAPHDMNKWSKKSVEQSLNRKIDWSKINTIKYTNQKEIEKLPDGSYKKPTSYIILNPNDIKIQEVTYEIAPGVYRNLSDTKFKEGGITKTENFKKWFGNSKVVDENGEPLVVYHGTTKSFDKFDINKGGKNTGEGINTYVGFYFTPDATLSEDFTRRDWTNPNNKIKQGSNIMPVYLSMKNPKVITAHQFTMGYFKHNTRDVLKSEGYDGVIITPFSKGEKEAWDNIFGKNSGSKEFDYNQYLVFDSTQIKSATGNNGEFNPNNPNILMEQGGKIPITQTENFKKWFGNSKVVDENGEPLVVYHGTDKEFNTFDTTKSFDSGLWFTSNLQALKKGEVGAGGSGKIMSVYLKIENMAGWDEYEKYSIDEIIRDGFDGIKLDDDYIAFSPNQIKSATGNNGEFNPNNPNILMEQGGKTKITKTENFKKWFSNSKVVDENGEPLVVYHGTDANFNIFKLSKTGAVGKGIYLTKYEDDAKIFGNKIMKLYAKIENPYIASSRDPETGLEADLRSLGRRLIKEGKYDGILWKGIWIAFSPNQIKSATGNNGEFNPNNPNILMEQGGKTKITKTENFKKWFGNSKVVDKKGEPLICYHGTNSDFNIFEEDRISHDKGYYGNGIYFTFNPELEMQELTKGEALYYGNKLMQVYLKVENPFDFSILSKYKGEDIDIIGATSFVFLYNIAKIFPNISKNIFLKKTTYNELINSNYETLRIIEEVPITIIPTLFKKYEKMLKTYLVKDKYDTSKDYITGYVKAEEKEEINYKGKIFKWIDKEDLGHYPTNFSKEEIEIGLICDAIEKYEGLKPDFFPEGYITRHPEITEAIKKQGYDGIIQSKDGDEIVVFSPNQIKSATGNNGEFNPNNPNILMEQGGSTNNLPSENEKKQYLINTQNELSYLFDKPVAQWDDYDISNWQAKVNKQEHPEQYNEGGDIRTHLADQSSIGQIKLFEAGGETKNAPKITIIDGNKVTEKGNVTYNWETIPEYSKVIDTIKQYPINIDADDKGFNLLEKTFTANDEFRPQMNGIYFDKKGFVASDSHRFIYFPYRTPKKLQGKVVLIDKKESKLQPINDKFPNYVQILPNNFSKDFNKGGVFKITVKKLLTFLHTTPYFAKLGTITNFMYKDASGEYNKISFNRDYLKEILEFALSQGHEKLNVLITLHNDAVIFTKENEKFSSFNENQFLMLLMPLHSEEYSEENVHQHDIGFNRTLDATYDFTTDKVVSNNKHYEVKINENTNIKDYTQGGINQSIPYELFKAFGSKLYDNTVQILGNFVVINGNLHYALGITPHVIIKNTKFANGIYNYCKKNKVIYANLLDVNGNDATEEFPIRLLPKKEEKIGTINTNDLFVSLKLAAKERKGVSDFHEFLNGITLFKDKAQTKVFITSGTKDVYIQKLNADIDFSKLGKTYPYVGIPYNVIAKLYNIFSYTKPIEISKLYYKEDEYEQYNFKLKQGNIEVYFEALPKSNLFAEIIEKSKLNKLEYPILSITELAHNNGTKNFNYFAQKLIRQVYKTSIKTKDNGKYDSKQDAYIDKSKEPSNGNDTQAKDLKIWDEVKLIKDNTIWYISDIINSMLTLVPTKSKRHKNAGITVYDYEVKPLKEIKNTRNPNEIPKPIQDLINDMVKEGLYSRTVKMGNKERFLKDIQPAINAKMLRVKELQNGSIQISLIGETLDKATSAKPIKKEDDLKIIKPKGNTPHDIQARKFIDMFNNFTRNKRNRLKFQKFISNNFKTNDYEMYVFINGTHSIKDIEYTKTIEEIYKFALNYDTETFHILRIIKKGNEVTITYNEAWLFGDADQDDMYDAKGNLKQSVKTDAINIIKNNFGIEEKK